MRLSISRRLVALARKRQRAPKPSLYPLATLIANASEGDKVAVTQRELDRLDRKDARKGRR